MPTAHNPELVLPPPAPDVYGTEAELTASLLRKGTAEPGPGLYPRDGTVAVTEIEEALSELTIPGQRFNVVVGSGMAAVSGAVEFALSQQGRAGRGSPKLVHSIELYSQSLRAFEHLRYMGVSVDGFDAGNKTVEELIEAKRPDVVFSETVANTPAMPVLDVHGLLALTREQGEDGPIVVLDNTLPLSTGLDFNDILRPEDRVLIVESATKSAMHNSEHLGVVYSKNEGLIDAFRRFKATKGLVTSTHADQSILRTLEAAAPSFHERNRALFESTGKLAVALAEAQQALGSDPEFTVSFPTFDDHPHQAYVAEHLPDGVSPLVFMGCKGFDPELARQLLIRLTNHPRIREQISEGQIFMGQSFGFREARLLYDRNCPQVRVAGGYDIDSDALADALREAAADV